MESKKPTQDFSKFIDGYADKAYRFAFRLAQNEQDARDLVQEAFTHALEHMESYDPARPFGPWFNQILKNIFINGVRRYEHKHSISLDGSSPLEDGSWEDIIPGNDLSPLEKLGQLEIRNLVQIGLELLPPHYRMAVILCDIEGYSYEQIAEILHCPIGTVRSRIHQGRLLMRKEIEQWESGAKQNPVESWAALEEKI